MASQVARARSAHPPARLACKKISDAGASAAMVECRRVASTPSRSNDPAGTPRPRVEPDAEAVAEATRRPRRRRSASLSPPAPRRPAFRGRLLTVALPTTGRIAGAG
ncbi:hypothetical protein HBB16_06715 [Pseudonocardia sp. MCCB 268]|nr:hypothetical protein [Pseudonocardia cytotoxica]